MNAQRAPSATSSTHSAMSWWYTLAHEETPPAGLGVSASALDAFTKTLATHGQPTPAALVARIAREVERAEAKQRALAPLRGLGALTLAPAAQPGEERYVWAFRRLADALAAVRANHRSDYHAYPHPRNMHEASLDRLYQRFPLRDYPRTTILLFTGVRVCDDPRLRADPRADALTMELPALVAREDWERYTVCGFRQGVSLVRVMPNARWLRIGAHALEDAWADARHDLDLSALGDADDATLRMAETRAHDTLLGAAPDEAFMRLDDPVGVASASVGAPERTTSTRSAERPALRGGKRLPYAAGRPAV